MTKVIRNPESDNITWMPTEIFDLCDGAYEIAMLTVIARIYDEYGHVPLSLDEWAERSPMSRSKVSTVLQSLLEREVIEAVPAISADRLSHLSASATDTNRISYGRTDHRCCHCRKEYPLLEQHHIVPHSEGGTDSPDNITWLCPNCHRLAHAVVYIPCWNREDYYAI